MSNVWWITRRELIHYLRSPLGYVIITIALIIDGLLFNAVAVGPQQRLSSVVLQDFFWCASGTTMAASIFIAMRLIAEERQTGTLTLLATSPIRDWQIVLGKFAGAMVLLAVMNALTLYMPLLLMLNGKISVGHLVAGYLGLMLIGAAAVSLGLLCSSLAPNQLIAAIAGTGVVLVFILLWILARLTTPPLEDVLAYLSIHDKHFRPFQKGLVSVSDVVFYVTLSYVALLAATRALEARRWRG
ncbi:MAG: ABC transporter permease [Myxococcota bacterium]